ncbi:FAD-containing oxidoreductase [Fulvivirga ligni]|uniref:FAD-containing oxidoreductase n=1 Tax=Fulvivirga ligni TaxID=2904246 RepID=UPI001F444A35|nr:FAD-containing oxidoreductase [Fulvivirga ligni]UII23345.1 FAD-containing oxidoreductase [Fulvivirga ligni]
MEYDAIIIGAGQAGPPLAFKLAKAGHKVAIIERKYFGGTCVNTGCTPTKTMIASAKVAYTVKRAQKYGISGVSNFKVDFHKVRERRDEIVLNSRDGLKSSLENAENITVFEGHAKFTSNKSILINNQELHAEKIFINTGGRARVGDHEEGLDCLTNSSMMKLEELPEHLVIIGGSYIGIEFAQMFKRFGSKVTIVEKGPCLVSREDEEVSKNVQDILEKEGIQVRTNAECIYAKHSEDGGVEVEINCEDGDPSVFGTRLLYAIGRQPNTDELGLENTEIEMSEEGFIKVDEHLQTSVAGIYALGDCNGQGAFTHTAYNDYEIAIDHVLGEGKRKLSDRKLCYALYMDPPLARVGLNEAEVREKNIKVLKAEMPMDKVARAREKGETEGFMKILIDKESDLILGAVILGTGADEIIHSILDVMYAEKPYALIRDAVHIHPTISELIPTMLENLQEL